MKITYKSKTAICLVLILLAAVFTGCSKDNALSGSTKSNKITVVLDWTPNTNHTGLYVAQVKGYFKNAGLEVEIISPPEDGAEALVASGKAQFGISFQDSLAPALASENPLPITAVAALIQHNTSGIVSRKGEGLDKPSGLEGKNYATWDMAVEKAILKNVVEKDGGDISKVNFVPSTVTDEVTALNTKSVDAIWIFYAWAGIATEVKGLSTDYFAFKDINPVFDYYTPILIANNDFLKNSQDQARSFLEALKKGYEDAIAEPLEAADLLLEMVPELDQEIVKKSQVWLADQYKAEVERWGYIDAGRWNAFYDWLFENDLIETKLPQDTGFTNDYLPE